MTKQSDGTDTRIHVSPGNVAACTPGRYAMSDSVPNWRDANCVPCRMAAAPDYLPRIYVAGPLSSDPTRTFEEKAAAFEDAAASLDGWGYVAVPATYVDPDCGLTPDECVATQVHKMPSQGQGKHSWECYMRSDLRALLHCQGVALLQGWEGSPGAIGEFNTARLVAIEARPLEGWYRGSIGEGNSLRYDNLRYPRQPFHGVDNVCNRCGRPSDERREVEVLIGGWLHYDCWRVAFDGAEAGLS